MFMVDIQIKEIINMRFRGTIREVREWIIFFITI